MRRCRLGGTTWECRKWVQDERCTRGCVYTVSCVQWTTGSDRIVTTYITRGPPQQCLINPHYNPRSSGRFNNRPSIPPATVITCPVTCPERVGDETMTTWLATSSGVATFFIGVLQKPVNTDQQAPFQKPRKEAHVARAGYMTDGSFSFSTFFGVITYPVGMSSACWNRR